MLNEDDGGSLGGFASILGQFGLGGMSSPESNLDKILELSRTRTITQKAIFDSISLNNKSDFLANHLIESLEQQNKWASKGILSFMGDDGYNLADFRFQHDSFPAFTILENKALKKLHGYINGGEKYAGIFNSAYSELSGIMNFSITTNDPQLSIHTVNNLFDRLSDYYIEKTAGKQKRDFEIIQSKYDSITQRLASVQYTLAQFEDQHRGLFRKQDLLREKQLKGEEYKLATMVGEAEKQFQIAQLTLENKTAYIQLIDKPLLPLKPVNKGALYYFLVGGFIGGLLSCVYVILRKMYNSIMSNN